jgi:hypothetical protein
LRRAGRHRTDPADAIQAEGTQPRQLERHLLRDVPQRVASLVPVRGGVGQFATADAVEHDQDDAGKGTIQGQEFGEK